MATVKSHKDLMCWQLSEQLKDRVYEITARPEALRDRDFCEDIRRSSRSAPANLAEAFGRYRPRDAARFVRIAIGSLDETLTHLGHAGKQGLTSEIETVEFLTLATAARRASCGWLAYLNSCPPDGPRKRRPRTDSEP